MSELAKMKMFPGALAGSINSKGIPIIGGAQINPQHPKQAPQQMLAMVIACLLNKPAADMDMMSAVANLVAERHAHFHVNARTPDLDFTKCSNPICVRYTQLMESKAQVKQEVDIDLMQLQTVVKKRVMFQVRNGHIHVFLEDQNIVPPEAPLIVTP
jgi:hypothetical protein